MLKTIKTPYGDLLTVEPEPVSCDRSKGVQLSFYGANLLPGYTCRSCGAECVKRSADGFGEWEDRRDAFIREHVDSEDLVFEANVRASPARAVSPKENVCDGRS